MRHLSHFAAFVLLVITGDVMAKSPPSLTIRAQSMDDGRCMVALDGRSFDIKNEAALKDALSPYADSKPGVHLVGDVDTPYRCLGSVIYALQRKGYNKIGFISEPPQE